MPSELLDRLLSPPVQSPHRDEPASRRHPRPAEESGPYRRTAESTRTKLPSQLDNADGVATPVGISLRRRAAFLDSFYRAFIERHKTIQNVSMRSITLPRRG